MVPQRNNEAWTVMLATDAGEPILAVGRRVAIFVCAVAKQFTDMLRSGALVLAAVPEAWN